VIYRGPSMLDATSIGVIATGFGKRSRNTKTGHVTQACRLPTQHMPAKMPSFVAAARAAGLSLMVATKSTHALCWCFKRRQLSGRTLGHVPARDIINRVDEIWLNASLIPLPDHSEFMMYGNDVTDLTILGLRSM
jgi:hypothetical protein